MITVRETEKYMVDPKDTIDRAFEGAYLGSLEKMPQSPPDYLSSIWGAASILFVGILYILVAIHSMNNGESPTVWIILAGVCVAIDVFIIARLLKSHKAFKAASGGEDKKELERKRFYAVMDYDNQPAKISASEYSKQISPMIGKQSKDLYNSGVRRIADYLGTVNNPQEISCKLLTPFGTVFNQAKKRFYVSVKEGRVLFVDFDFSNPKGEISCSEDDIISYGYYAKYPQSAFSKVNGKIRADAVILEVDDGTTHLFFEFLPQDGPEVKKMFSGRKEIK